MVMVSALTPPLTKNLLITVPFSLISSEKGSTTRLTASSTTIQYGDSVILTCVVEGYPEPTEPTLIKSGSSKQIEWSSPCTGTNRKECLKKFLSTTYSDSGQYICAGSNTIDGNENKSEDRLDLLIGIFFFN